MPVTPSYRTFVEEQLGRVTEVRTRSMFGGVGIYAGDRFFAMIADDTTYFKVDDVNRGDYESAGMEPFRPYKDKSKTMQYFALPAHVLEDMVVLQVWIERALAAAEMKK